ncbi:MAG: hypothetical protein K6G17_06540 [Oscillospiraceae bacterium]|nr:hypothetical protein [Oscillospiraceae bacterium]
MGANDSFHRQNPQQEGYPSLDEVISEATPPRKGGSALKKILIGVAAVLALALLVFGAVKLIGALGDSGSSGSSGGSGKSDRENSGGSYQDAVDDYVKLHSTGRLKAEDAIELTLNGVDDGALRSMLKIAKKTYYIQDSLDALEEELQDDYESLTDSYGRDFKIRYKIEDKEKLDEDELADVQRTLRDAGTDLLDELEELDEYSADEWEDLADELGLSVSDAKKLVKELEAIGKKLERVKVSEGYELGCTFTVKGSDAKTESSSTLHVLKINGKWVCVQSIRDLYYASGLYRLF